jgi:putative addiction module CopG family antidote
MQHFYPADVVDFVRQSLAAGEYGSEEELVVDAMRLLREVRQRREALRQDIQVAIEAMDTGQGRVWDVEDLKQQLRNQTVSGNGM